jgi:hypothetical protein
MLDVADLHFDRGPFGKIHVRNPRKRIDQQIIGKT